MITWLSVVLLRLFLPIGRSRPGRRLRRPKATSRMRALPKTTARRSRAVTRSSPMTSATGTSRHVRRRAVGTSSVRSAAFRRRRAALRWRQDSRPYGWGARHSGPRHSRWQARSRIDPPAPSVEGRAISCGRRPARNLGTSPGSSGRAPRQARPSRSRRSSPRAIASPGTTPTHTSGTGQCRPLPLRSPSARSSPFALPSCCLDRVWPLCRYKAMRRRTVLGPHPLGDHSLHGAARHLLAMCP